MIQMIPAWPPMPDQAVTSPLVERDVTSKAFHQTPTDNRNVFSGSDYLLEGGLRRERRENRDKIHKMGSKKWVGLEQAGTPRILKIWNLIKNSIKFTHLIKSIIN